MLSCFYCRDTIILPTGQVGFFSYICLSYLTEFFWNVFKTRDVDVDNIWKLSEKDSARWNTERYAQEIQILFLLYIENCNLCLHIFYFFSADFIGFGMKKFRRKARIKHP